MESPVRLVNPLRYTCCNWQKQCSWTHSKQPPLEKWILSAWRGLGANRVKNNRKALIGTLMASHLLQGSYGSWKTWKVMEFYNFIFRAWKVLKFRCGSWNVMENQYAFYEWKAIRSNSVLSIRAGSRPKQPATGQSLAGYFLLTFLRNLK